MSDPETASVADVDTNSLVGNRRALFTVIAIVFIDLLGFGIIIPILPYYIRSFGVSDVYIGLLAATYSFFQFVFAPVLGQISDRYGRRPVLMLSVSGNVVAWVLFGLGTEFEALFGVTGALLSLFVARAVAGAMGGNIATAQAYIADVTTEERRANALGLIGAAFGLGFIFGPALGGLFASDAAVSVARDVFPAFVPTTVYSLPSFAAAGLSFLALCATALFLREPSRTRTTAGDVSVGGEFVRALRDPNLRGLVVSFLLTSVAFAGVQVVFIPFAADRFGYDETQTALLLTYIGVIGVLNQGVIIRALSKRLRAGTIAVGGAALLGVALAFLPFTPAADRVSNGVFGIPPGVIALLAVLGVLAVGNGLLNVALSTLVSANASADQQGSAFGVTQGAGSLGRTVGPPVMAALYVLLYWSPFVVGAVLTAVVTALLVGIARSQSNDTDPTGSRT